MKNRIRTRVQDQCKRLGVKFFDDIEFNYWYRKFHFTGVNEIGLADSIYAIL